MSNLQNLDAAEAQVGKNGAAAAAILSAGIGSFALAIITVVSDGSPALKTALTFSKPVGPLSGVTTVAVIVWIAVWIVLELLWKKRNLPLTRINWAAIVLLGVSLLLTFPPIGDLF